MNAQEREALIELVADHIGGDHHHIRKDMPEVRQRARESVAGPVADALLAAGWTHPDLLPVPVPDADTIEDAITDEIHNHLSEFVSWAEDTDDASGYHVLNDVPVFEVALVARRALAAANLLASPVREPGRSEAEIKAEGAREALNAAADDIDREAAEESARHDVADVRCTDCDLRYGERDQYGCGPDGRYGHSYDERELAKAREVVVEPTYDGDQLRARAAQVSDTEGGE